MKKIAIVPGVKFIGNQRPDKEIKVL